MAIICTQHVLYNNNYRLTFIDNLGQIYHNIIECNKYFGVAMYAYQ